MGNDFFFRMGSLHTVCQDYALSGYSENRQYALVSDGCSGVPNPDIPGSPFTDFGSRFLIRATCRYLTEIDGYFPAEIRSTFPVIKIAADAASMARQAMLSPTSLDATLVGAILSADRLITFRYGDGVVIVKYKDGSIYFDTTKFGQNMPNYLRYALDPKVQEAYIAQAREQEVTKGVKSLNDSWGHISVTCKLAEVPALDVQIFDPAAVDFVLVCSDGLESFMTKDNRPVPIEDVIGQITSIRSFPGKFVTRRCSAFLDRFCREQQWRHTDDFSVAGISVDGGSL